MRDLIVARGLASDGVSVGAALWDCPPEVAGRNLSADGRAADAFCRSLPQGTGLRRAARDWWWYWPLMRFGFGDFVYRLEHDYEFHAFSVTVTPCIDCGQHQPNDGCSGRRP